MFLTYSGLIAAVVVAIIGGAIFWANPSRRINTIVFTCSLHIALWLFLLYIATSAQGRVTWLRAMCALSAFVPFHFALLEESIAWVNFNARSIRRCAPLFVFCVALAVLCFTDYFIPHRSTVAHKVFNWGYYAYAIGALLGYCYVLLLAFRDLGKVTGGRRLELQVWQMGASGMTAAILTMMVLRAVLGNPIYAQLQPLSVLAFYGATAYAITTHRIFGAGQLLRLLTIRVIPMLMALLVGIVIYRLSIREMTPNWSVAITVILAVGVASFGHRWLAKKFELYSEDTAARRAAFEAARHEMRLDRLESRFADVLKGWGRAEFAIVSSGASGNFVTPTGDIPTDSAAMSTLRELGWATPERLSRERPTAGRQALGAFLVEHRMGLAVVIQGPTISVLSAAGFPASRRPFGYPQAVQLMELTSIFEGPLERAHLAEKMQHAEQLATVGMLGASLAHEIRNPLVSLKAFVQLLPTRHHEPAFREKFFHLMSDEVKRIDRLTEQLLDVASPRAYSAQVIDLNEVVKNGLELVAPRADDAKVKLIIELKAEQDKVHTDPAAVKQVLLNLCLNAIQVLEAQQERWVRIVTTTGQGFVEMTVTDSGPGISPQIRNKLFQPFQSTKSSGFGLGLAICRDILAGLNATIAAAPPEPGQGATFRVTFPCPP